MPLRLEEAAPEVCEGVPRASITDKRFIDLFTNDRPYQYPNGATLPFNIALFHATLGHHFKHFRSLYAADVQSWVRLMFKAAVANKSSFSPVLVDAVFGVSSHNVVLLQSDDHRRNVISFVKQFIASVADVDKVTRGRLPKCVSQVLRDWGANLLNWAGSSQNSLVRSRCVELLAYAVNSCNAAQWVLPAHGKDNFNLAYAERAAEMALSLADRAAFYGFDCDMALGYLSALLPNGRHSVTVDLPTARIVLDFAELFVVHTPRAALRNAYLGYLCACIPVLCGADDLADLLQGIMRLLLKQCTPRMSSGPTNMVYQCLKAYCWTTSIAATARRPDYFVAAEELLGFCFQLQPHGSHFLATLAIDIGVDAGRFSATIKAAMVAAAAGMKAVVEGRKAPAHPRLFQQPHGVYYTAVSLQAVALKFTNNGLVRNARRVQKFKQEVSSQEINRLVELSMQYNELMPLEEAAGLPTVVDLFAESSLLMYNAFFDQAVDTVKECIDEEINQQCEWCSLAHGAVQQCPVSGKPHNPKQGQQWRLFRALAHCHDSGLLIRSMSSAIEEAPLSQVTHALVWNILHLNRHKKRRMELYLGIEQAILAEVARALQSTGNVFAAVMHFYVRLIEMLSHGGSSTMWSTRVSNLLCDFVKGFVAQSNHDALLLWNISNRIVRNPAVASLTFQASLGTADNDFTMVPSNSNANHSLYLLQKTLQYSPEMAKLTGVTFARLACNFVFHVPCFCRSVLSNIVPPQAPEECATALAFPRPDRDEFWSWFALQFQSHEAVRAAWTLACCQSLIRSLATTGGRVSLVGSDTACTSDLLLFDATVAACTARDDDGFLVAVVNKLLASLSIAGETVQDVFGGRSHSPAQQQDAAGRYITLHLLCVNFYAATKKAAEEDQNELLSNPLAHLQDTVLRHSLYLAKVMDLPLWRTAPWRKVAVSLQQASIAALCEAGALPESAADVPTDAASPSIGAVSGELDAQSEVSAARSSASVGTPPSSADSGGSAAFSVSVSPASGSSMEAAASPASIEVGMASTEIDLASQPHEEGEQSVDVAAHLPQLTATQQQQPANIARPAVVPTEQQEEQRQSVTDICRDAAPKLPKVGQCGGVIATDAKLSRAIWDIVRMQNHDSALRDLDAIQREFNAAQPPDSLLGQLSRLQNRTTALQELTAASDPNSEFNVLRSGGPMTQSMLMAKQNKDSALRDINDLLQFTSAATASMPMDGYVENYLLSDDAHFTPASPIERLLPVALAKAHEMQVMERAIAASAPASPLQQPAHKAAAPLEGPKRVRHGQAEMVASGNTMIRVDPPARQPQPVVMHPSTDRYPVAPTERGGLAAHHSSNVDFNGKRRATPPTQPGQSTPPARRGRPADHPKYSPTRTSPTADAQWSGNGKRLKVHRTESLTVTDHIVGSSRPKTPRRLNY